MSSEARLANNEATIDYRDLVVIGSGMAAIRLVETLRKRGDCRSIVLLGAERALPYNRILLSPLLGGEIAWQQLISHPAEWYEQQNIELRLGHTVSAIDRELRRVHCEGGYSVVYGQLVFATGARAALPRLPGIDLPGVTVFRSVADVTRLQQACTQRGRAVVLGGGLLGLEAAVALALRGMSVTLVHRANQLMNRQLDAVAANYLQRAIERRGVRIITGRAPIAVQAGECNDEQRASGVVLQGDELLPADLVVVATGIEPLTDLARMANLPVARGIVVDNAMATSDAAIFALGECCERDGETVGLVAPIWQQVEVLAANLCGEAQQFTHQPYVTMLKVSGIDVHVMGEVDAIVDTGLATTDGVRMLAYQDRERGIYKKLLLRDGCVIGALLFGDIADSQLFFRLIQQKTAVGSDHCRLLVAGEVAAGDTVAGALSSQLNLASQLDLASA
ncbi:MAG TPA: FAD-dependent oxidoreductase [Spongiibacteraceae bacterium]|nr:FAD-dependent oxidoreductase [Spongiibacteraceae bacterium]